MQVDSFLPESNGDQVDTGASGDSCQTAHLFRFRGIECLERIHRERPGLLPHRSHLDRGSPVMNEGDDVDLPTCYPEIPPYDAATAFNYEAGGKVLAKAA